MAADRNASTVWLAPVGEERGFHVQYRDDHVHVTLGKGLRVDAETSERFWAGIREVCKRHDSCRVLVEGYVPEGDQDTGSVIGAGLRTGSIPNLWMAFCFKDFEPTDQSELYETIAARTGTHIKYFKDPQQALTWLRANTKQ